MEWIEYVADVDASLEHQPTHILYDVERQLGDLVGVVRIFVQIGEELGRTSHQLRRGDRSANRRGNDVRILVTEANEFLRLLHDLKHAIGWFEPFLLVLLLVT